MDQSHSTDRTGMDAVGWKSTHDYQQAVTVPFSFPVLFTTNAFHPDNSTIAEIIRESDDTMHRRVLVFVDDAVARTWPDLSTAVRKYFDNLDGCDVVGPITPVPGGDAAKDGLSIVQTVGQLAATYRIDRQSYIMVIGGGAVLDAVGLGAALVHRGVRLIRMPTTVLGQNDAGVGVKNGVNAFGQKNFFGCFAPPYAVINDTAFLRSLTERDWMAGAAEAIKVACIKDLDFFHWIEENAAPLRGRDLPTLAEMIRRCAGLHLDHIRENGDPFEFGSARPLDFGHWSAHWLEIISKGAVTHGEAVAIGIAIDAAYASASGYITREEAERIVRALHSLGFALWHPALAFLSDSGSLQVLEGLDHFREHLGGCLTLTFPSPLGGRIEVTHVDRTLLQQTILSFSPEA